MKTYFVTVMLFCLCMTSLAESNAKDYLVVKIGFVGTNATFHVQGKPLSHTNLFRRLDRLAEASKAVEVFMVVAEDLPIGILRSLHQDVKKMGFTTIYCVLLQEGRPPSAIYFSTKDLPPDTDIVLDLLKPKDDEIEPPDGFIEPDMDGFKEHLKEKTDLQQKH